MHRMAWRDMIAQFPLKILQPRNEITRYKFKFNQNLNLNLHLIESHTRVMRRIAWRVMIGQRPLKFLLDPRNWAAQITRYKFKFNQNLNLNLHLETPRNQSFSISGISGMQQFQMKLSYHRVSRKSHSFTPDIWYWADFSEFLALFGSERTLEILKSLSATKFAT